MYNGIFYCVVCSVNDHQGVHLKPRYDHQGVHLKPRFDHQGVHLKPRLFSLFANDLEN